jgi:effector-binding domain-containing protein
MNAFFRVCVIVLTIPATGIAYEKAFEPTEPGEIEIKTIPERTLIVAGKKDNYFNGSNVLFGHLFRYIQDHDVSMTVPVKADIEPGRMSFYVGSEDLGKNLKNRGAVEVITEPEQRVISMGFRGGYTEKNFEKARDELIAHLDDNNGWTKNGEAYAVFWNGPYVPAFMKKFEVHVPVIATIGTENENGRVVQQ